MTYHQFLRQLAIRDARKASKSDKLDRRIPLLDTDFDNLVLWS